MPLIRPCRAHGCEILTMGQYCIEHELPVGNVVRPELFVTTRERTFATAPQLTRVSSLRIGSARPAGARHRR